MPICRNAFLPHLTATMTSPGPRKAPKKAKPPRSAKGIFFSATLGMCCACASKSKAICPLPVCILPCPKMHSFSVKPLQTVTFRESSRPPICTKRSKRQIVPVIPTGYVSFWQALLFPQSQMTPRPTKPFHVRPGSRSCQKRKIFCLCCPRAHAQAGSVSLRSPSSVPTGSSLSRPSPKSGKARLPLLIFSKHTQTALNSTASAQPFWFLQVLIHNALTSFGNGFGSTILGICPATHSRKRYD